MRSRKAKKHTVYLDVKEIPTKISEIISYLSMDFAKNHLLDRDDLAQDLYVLYLTTIKKRPSLVHCQPGFFFIKFKWFLLKKWRKRVNDLNREWDYKRSTMPSTDRNNYDHCRMEEFKKKVKTPKNKKKYNKEKYGF